MILTDDIMKINKEQAKIILMMYETLEAVRKELTEEQLNKIHDDNFVVPLLGYYDLEIKLKEFLGCENEANEY